MRPSARLTPAGIPTAALASHQLLRGRVPPVFVYKQSTTLSGLISSSVSGIVGSRAERVKPQNFWGDMSFWVAVNFHPTWLAQALHWATVQANLQEGEDVSAGGRSSCQHCDPVMMTHSASGARSCVYSPPSQAHRQCCACGCEPGSGAAAGGRGLLAAQ